MQNNNQNLSKRTMLMGFTFLVMFFVLFQPATMYSQTPDEVKSAIDQLEKGELDAVKAKLPTLITKYQNEAGILFLQARLTSNAIEATQYYQTIVNNFAKSEWADDALYRLYQYYYALGLFRTANTKLQQLKNDFPQSPYLKDIDSGVSVSSNTNQEQTEKVQEQQVSTVEEEKPNVESAPARTFQERFVLQVGAFSTSENAEKQKSYFEERGFPVEVASKLQNGKSLYKVWVGAYKTRDEAEKASKDVKSKYRLDSMVIERY